MVIFTPTEFTSEDIFDSFFAQDNQLFQEQQWTYNTTESEANNFFMDQQNPTEEAYDDEFFENLFLSPENLMEQSTEPSDNNASSDSIDIFSINPAALSISPRVFEAEIQNSRASTEGTSFSDVNTSSTGASPSPTIRKHKKSAKTPKNSKSNGKISLRTTPRKAVIYQNTPTMVKKVEKLYKQLKENNVIAKAMQRTKETMIRLEISPLKFDLVKNFTLPALMPNNYTVRDFENIQGKNGYEYLTNATHSSTWATPRWMNNKKNFYQPSVIRKVRNEQNKLVEAEGLCPYCPLHDLENPDDNFYSMGGALYQHHLCKNHGVYTSGLEMPVPAIGVKDDLLFACCTKCSGAVKLRLQGDTMQNCLKAYYRHCFEVHNISKKKLRNP